MIEKNAKKIEDIYHSNNYKFLLKKHKISNIYKNGKLLLYNLPNIKL